MSKITCAISGITYSCDHVPLTLNSQELAHPIFYTTQKRLLQLYRRYHNSTLTDTDSYLLFLALLHSTDSVTFAAPCSLDPTGMQTAQLIASNIRQLIEVIWQTNAIIHPRFKQPSYILRSNTADLSTIHNWIKSWHKNIELFKLGEATAREQEQLVHAENKLLLIIRRGINDSVLANTTANWAAMAANFPSDKQELWKKTIRSCFNEKVMFNTPRILILEIKHYCEDNIMVGSSHFHTLMEILRTGYKNHIDYLGLDTLESLTDSAAKKGYNTTFTLCPEGVSKEEIATKLAIEQAPKKLPVRTDYPDLLSYVRAKSKYMLVQCSTAQVAPVVPTEPTDPTPLIDLIVNPMIQDTSISDDITPESIASMNTNIDTSADTNIDTDTNTNEVEDNE